MKKTIFSTFLILLLALVIPSHGSENNAQSNNLLIGDWVNQKSDILKFTADKKVFLNGNKIGYFRTEGDGGKTIVVNTSNDSGDIKTEYYKLKKGNQNQFQLINLNSDKESKEGTFNKIVPDVE